MKTFIINKWHLHSLTLSGSLILLNLMQLNYFHLGNVGVLFQSFVAVFISAVIAYGIEWSQGVKGYNRTPEQLKASRLDILVSILFSVVAIPIYFGFKKQYLLIAITYALVVLILEIYRRRIEVLINVGLRTLSSKTKKSKFLDINKEDLFRGSITAAITAILTSVYKWVELGIFPTNVELVLALKMGLLAGVSYLLKNLFTNSEDEFFVEENN